MIARRQVPPRLSAVSPGLLEPRSALARDLHSEWIRERRDDIRHRFEPALVGHPLFLKAANRVEEASLRVQCIRLRIAAVERIVAREEFPGVRLGYLPRWVPEHGV